MKLSLFFVPVLLLIFISNCRRAVFDNITEGAGGILIGFRLAPALAVTNLPSTLDEGSSVKIGLRFSSSVSEETVSISSSNSRFVFSINPVKITSTDSTVDRQITMTSAEDADSLDEDVEITFSSKFNGKLVSKVKVIDKVSRGINLSLPSSTEEDAVKQLDVSLRIQPPESEVTLVLTPSDSAVTLSQTSLVFTQSNYNVSQKINYTINDQYNDSRSYSVTASIGSESVVRSTVIQDNDFYDTDLSALAGQNNNSGLNPSIDIMNSNARFYTAVKDNSNSSKLSIFSCDLAGANCSVMNKSLLPSNFSNGSRPKLSIDQISESVYITTKDADGNDSVSWKADSALNSLLHTGNVSNPYLLYDGAGSRAVNTYPVNLIINQKLINVYSGTSFTELHTINPDLTPQSFPVLVDFYGIQSFPVGSRGLKYDSVNSQLIFGLTNPADDINDPLYISALYYPMIQKFYSDGTLAAKIKINKPFAGLTPDLGIDTVNQKIVLLTANYNLDGKPYVFRCDLNAVDSSSCTEHDFSSGTVSSTYFPKLNIDTFNNKLLILAYNVNTLYLFHCSLDVSSCKATDISRGYSLLTSSDEHNFDSVIDTVNRRLLVVFTEKSTGKLRLVRFGLGGF